MVSFLLSTWHTLESSGKREPQLKNCLDQPGLWPSRWAIILISWLTDVGGPSPWWAGSSLANVPGLKMLAERASEQFSPLVSASALPWVPALTSSVTNCYLEVQDEISPFLPKLPLILVFTTATGSKVEQSILGRKQRPVASQKWAEKRRGKCAGGHTGCFPYLGYHRGAGSAVRGARVCILSVVDCVCLVLLNELRFPHMTHETRSLLEDERIERESTRWANTHSTKCLSFTGHPSLNTGAGPVCGSFCFRMMDSVVQTDA